MTFLAYVFLSHLPLVMEETRVVEGKEQKCLIIPTETNQIKRGKQGNWMMILRLAEKDLNARMQTHDVQLMYLNEDYIKKYRANGIHDRTMRMGRVYVHDRTPSKKLDRTNDASDLLCDGVIILSDIPKDMIFRNDENDKRYVSNLTFKNLQNDNTIHTGFICIDDIPRQMILTDPQTGKKYVNVRFKKLDKLDTYMNTHILVATNKEGSEIEIGRFKEWSKIGGAPSNPSKTEESQHNTTVVPRIPQSIDGYRF